MIDKVREEMQSQMQSGALFDQAINYGKEYLQKACGRHVAPHQCDQDALSAFDEPLPESKGDASSIIETLHRYGSPGTMAQTGGRFFGLVNGGLYPLPLRRAFGRCLGSKRRSPCNLSNECKAGRGMPILVTSAVGAS